MATIPQSILLAVTREAVLACVSPVVFERPKQHYKTYFAFCDPSGGSADSMTLAIGHCDGIIIIDALRETRPPFNPTTVVEEFAALCRSYGISKIIGDRYAGQWPVEHSAKLESATSTRPWRRTSSTSNFVAARPHGRVVDGISKTLWQGR
jgi:hypothetical protein